MSIIAPRQRDFDQILIDIGQTVTLRKITRVTDGNGRITGITTADTDIQAVVEEIGLKKVDLLAGGHYKIGDVDIYLNPDVDITIFDKIVWGTKILGIKNIKFEQKIAGYYIMKMLHCVQDSE